MDWQVESVVFQTHREITQINSLEYKNRRMSFLTLGGFLYKESVLILQQLHTTLNKLGQCLAFQHVICQ